MSETLTHWKKLTNPDYLGSYAFLPNEKKVATINKVVRKPVKGPDGKEEECSVCFFNEPSMKPLILNATNSKTITKVAGTPYVENWNGVRIEMYVEAVKAFGEIVDAVRVSKIKPAPKEKKPMVPNTDSWKKAIAAKASIEFIEERYSITPENKTLYVGQLSSNGQPAESTTPEPSESKPIETPAGGDVVSPTES